MTDQDKKILLEQSRITEKQRMIDQVVKESNADQRLTLYKAELIREIDGMRITIDKDARENGWDIHYTGYNEAISEVLDIIKKKQ